MKAFPSFKQFLLEKDAIYLYHATYKPLLTRIKREGLHGKRKKKNWTDSKNVVYLASDPHIAESYAESAEILDDEKYEHWIDQIIILRVKLIDLDKSKLLKDENVRSDENYTYQYDGVISFDKLEIIK